MKKRIISILLAAMMVVSVFVMPTSVSASVSNNYSYKFADNDARNQVEGQVIDFGYTGEAAAAPAMNGSLDNYQESQTFLASTASKGADKEVYYAVKDGYLYVAVETEDADRVRMQYNVGVAQWETSDCMLSRINFATTAAKDGFSLGRFIKYPKTGVEGTKWYGKGSAWADNGSNFNYGTSKPATVANFEAVEAFNNGIYEFKVNIAKVYEYFGVTVRGEDIWTTPCMTFFFFHDLGGANQCDYYVARGVSHKIGYVDTVTANPGTIILPNKTMDTIKAKANTVGALGTDHRNVFADQLTVLDKYSSDVKVDGQFTEDEHYEKTTVSATNHGQVTIKTSVSEDGFVYLGVKYAAATAPGNMLLGVGLVGNSSRMMTSRIQMSITAAGAISYNSMLIGDHTGTDHSVQAGQGTSTETYFGMTKSDFTSNFISSMLPATKAARTYVDGYATLEVKIALAPIIAIYDTLGWDTISANAIHVMLHDGSFIELNGTKDTSKLTSFYYETSVRPYPTIQLPIGATEKFAVDGIYDLEAYGQDHVNAIKNTVTLDGVISEGEYGAGVDSTAAALANAGVSITEYFSGDDDYIYIAAKIIDPHFTEGTTTYQWDIPVPARADGKVDNADTIRRVNAHIYHKEAGTQTNKPGNVWRTHVYTAGGNDGEKAVSAIIGEITNSGANVENFYKAKSIYNAATNTTVYEIAVSKAALRQCFDLDESYAFDTFAYFSYYATGNSVAAFSYDSLNDDATALARLGTMLKAMTARDIGLANYKYTACSPANVVVNFIDDVVTNKTASVRISTENSGLRFKTIYSDAYLAEMAAYAASKGETMQVGTLIAPNDFVTSAYAFTHAALGAGNYIEVFGDVATPYASGAGTKTIAGSIVNIKAANLDRDFAGIGFIKIGNEYFYADTYAVKNVSSVANAALNDTLKAEAPTAEYKYVVSEGVYSPYSEAKREILSALIK